MEAAINRSLCLYFFFLILLSTVLHHLLKPLWSILCKPSPEELPLRNEIRTLRAEQRELSVKDDFVSHSRIQRKLNKLEDELSVIAGARIEKNVNIKNTIIYVLHALLTLLIFISVVYYRKEPLVVLTQDLFPFENLFSYPSDVPHSITPHAWVIMCKISCGAVAKVLQKFTQENSRLMKAAPM